MPTPKFPKPDPKLYYVCVESHVGERGPFREGTRLRGDHADVVAEPIYWIDETADDDERHAAKISRFYSRDIALRRRRPHSPSPRTLAPVSGPPERGRPAPLSRGCAGSCRCRRRQLILE
jgi:hypothetical protein